MPVRLRGHHFLCILTYRGYGYTVPFVENMTRVVAEIEGGRPVLLCEGPDDICGGFTPHCRTVSDHDCGKPQTIDMDRAAIEAVCEVIVFDPGEPLLLDAAAIAALRKAFADNTIRSACQRCSWRDFCTEIAAEGFTATKLLAPDIC